MAQYVLRRVLQSVVLLLCATVVVFLLVRAVPADPAQVMLGETATPEAVAALRESLGLDRPLAVQYARYMQNLLHGDLGLSIRHVILTHFHADFVAGHLELAAATGASIHLGAEARAEYAFHPLHDRTNPSSMLMNVYRGAFG